MEDIGVIVGNRIKAFRNQRGISQEQLAFKAELNVSYLGLVERGVKSPTLKILDRIAGALDISLEELFDFNIAENDIEKLPVIDRIRLQLLGRTEDEQEAIFEFVKRLIKWKDND